MNTSFYGRLTRNPEFKNSNCTDYTVITVAVQMPIKDDEGKYKTVFVNVTAFGKQGVNVANFFHKGSRIVVDGIIRDINIGTSEHGLKYLNVYVTMTDFAMVDTRKESEGISQKNNSPAPNSYSPPPSASQENKSYAPSPWDF